MARTERKDKKTVLALLLLLLAIAIIIAMALAFFSDTATGTLSGTAGTLGIEMGSLSSTQYFSREGVAASQTFDPTNMNPGDYILINFDVTSLGSKSAWVIAELGALDFTVDPNNNNTPPDQTAVEAAFKLYAVPLDEIGLTKDYATVDAFMKALLEGTPLEVAAARALLVPADTNPNPQILSGTEEDDGEATITMQYILYFARESGNEFQGIAVDFDIDVKAMQYRNNDDPDWSTVASANFTFTP